MPIMMLIHHVNCFSLSPQSSLDSLVSDRELMVSQLNAPVHTLDQLKSTLELLHHITDLQNVIDSMYYPVEKMYSLLR